MKNISRYTNHTFIILVPKVDNAVTFNQFRPISLCNYSPKKKKSLCNYVYKIISKILATRLRKVIDKIISPNQGAFIKGRWIADYTSVAQELCHKMKKKERKRWFNDVETGYEESLR